MPETFSPGSIFAGYRIDRVLGAGGMGTVYLARHPRLPRFDALKVLSDELGADPEYRSRFLREADFAARLDHANIVAVHDRGIDDGCPWIAMQFVDGPDVAELLRRHPGGIPPHRAVHILGEVAQGLDEAHRRGLLHRDVKPANILLSELPGQPERALLTDFGIAKAAAESTVLTRTGDVLASLAYAAPEQLTAGVVDHRTDVYALGCTFFEMLTGRTPFPYSTTGAVMRAHVEDPPPRASEIVPALPRAVDTAIARAMAKDPGDRYNSCADFAAAAAAGSSGTPDPWRSDRRAPRRGRGRARMWAAIGLTAALLSIASVLVLHRNSNDAHAAPSAAPTSPGTTWGNYAFIVAAFPTVLPATPLSTGYLGIRCRAVDDDRNTLSLTAPLGAELMLDCRGNGDPARFLGVDCKTDRSRNPLPPWTPQATVLGAQSWERSSGSGRMEWATIPVPSGGTQGSLQISFEDPGRSFCYLTVWGNEGTSGGAELLEHWWPDAPL